MSGDMVRPEAHPRELHRPEHPVRFVTAASLFDGHDAAINIMRRLLQSQGAEVVHLGHNRSVDEVVTAAVQEDVQGVAVSSYQGGHIEYFKYLVDRLGAEGRGDIKVYGGGGGTIVASEVAELHDYGVARIFTPHDGQELGLAAMVNTMIEACDHPLEPPSGADVDRLAGGDQKILARTITAAESRCLPVEMAAALAEAPAVPVLGITGTGGSGKSSLTDELVRRFRIDQEDKLRIAVLAVDPTRRRGGGALLGDRIRMNSIDADALDTGRVYFRSMATRGAISELPDSLDEAIAALKAAGFDLIVVETPGIGQGDAAVVPHVDLSLYVMTPEFGAASQLEKIDMLDLADVVAINKFERRGGADALRDVSRQLVRNREAFGARPEDMPVFGTSAATFNDNGVTALYQHLGGLLKEKGLPLGEGVLPAATGRTSTGAAPVIPPERVNYLGDIAATVRGYHEQTAREVEAARRLQRLTEVAAELEGDTRQTVADLADQAREQLGRDSERLLKQWP
ncbi:MAG TPA: cobalamin-dependent protein, partial [Acidimicrobiales bacterium]